MAIQFNMTFLPVHNCPSCDSNSKQFVGRLSEEGYNIGQFIIPYRKIIGSINIFKCKECGLLFKDWLPAKTDLLELFRVASNEIWTYGYHYSDEVQHVKSLFPTKKPDILDVGASNGGFLFSLTDVAGRLSALDVVENAHCKKFVTGEYILGFLDHEHLMWSGDAYDIVTVFDVVEHFYDVKQGFLNLSSLIKAGGYCIVETGNSDNFLPILYGVSNWWYLSHLYHHVAFNFDSLTKLARSSGLRLIKFIIKRQKNIKILSPTEFFKLSIKSAIYLINPPFYRWITAKLVMNGAQPICPFNPDHLLMVFQKVA